jgi:large subunit ribosomal protein L10
MERAQKIEAVAELSERVAKAPLAIVTQYRGLNVAQMTDLRTRLRKIDGEYLVAKNSLLRIAIAESSWARLEPLLTGPNAIAFAYSEAIAVAKIVRDFAKEHEALAIKGGILDGEILDAQQIERLATMPGRNELRAQLLAVLSAPATNLVRVLQAPARQLVQVLEARRQQQEK